jgi:hypothetical protein
VKILLLGLITLISTSSFANDRLNCPQEDQYKQALVENFVNLTDLDHTSLGFALNGAREFVETLPDSSLRCSTYRDYLDDIKNSFRKLLENNTEIVDENAISSSTIPFSKLIKDAMKKYAIRGRLIDAKLISDDKCVESEKTSHKVTILGNDDIVHVLKIDRYTGEAVKL